jgi:hypothetical protein
MLKKFVSLISRIKVKIIYLSYDIREIILSFFIKNQKEEFSNKKFQLISIEEFIIDDLKSIFSEKLYTKISNKNNKMYLNSNLPENIIQKLNSTLNYIDCNKVSEQIIKNILMSIYNPVKTVLNSNWKCIQVRAWITKKNSSEKIGPLKFHTDGMPKSVFKIMIFPESINKLNGSIELENEGILSWSGPSALLFQNSSLLHRSIPGTDKDRPVIELTIMKNLTFNNNYKIGDINSTIPLVCI